MAASAALEVIGQSDVFLGFMEHLSQAAAVDRPVLIVGERGTGKELAARRLHFLSPRWQGPFGTLNCAALAPSLLESELFGHEAGAFTGAAARRAGRFEAADSGTLFLDEIGNMPLTAQEKILRVVEYGEFDRVGGSTPLRVDVRIIGATNADLPALAQAGRFKRDLLDRLSFEVLTIPPLRARRDDILLLATHFAARMAVELGRGDVPAFSATAQRTLLTHDWPGNVRELRNAVERATYRAQSERIDDIQLDPFASPFRPREMPSADETRQTPPASSAPESMPSADLPDGGFPEAVRQFEIALLTDALDRARHNQRKAAELLGLTYNQFRTLYRKYTPELAD
ncbi:psp operon transcriptional activator [Desulfobaculum xiamenense]|uniref:Psp operon transcriptional activator n=1 Tax=Desulfobaculum xiamenense TaxID=995050 RepID=A0A846QRM8_9BACT|nr:phage shock protein operon transcriptional activator [Desulfobaculum xiamenense]NJB67844.1 psp operon transcriptional activator [Desulfobaculum xiamenense]